MREKLLHNTFCSGSVGRGRREKDRTQPKSDAKGREKEQNHLLCENLGSSVLLSILRERTNERSEENLEHSHSLSLSHSTTSILYAGVTLEQIPCRSHADPPGVRA